METQKKTSKADKFALIIVDAQYDFCPGGALAVTGGDEIVPVINEMIPLFSNVVTTQDWHPADHCSFAEKPEFKDKSWPKHCVRETKGAQIHLGIRLPATTAFVHKGQHKEVEEYSGFCGYIYNPSKEFHSKSSVNTAGIQGYGDEDRLISMFRARNIKEVFVCGLATDYCVKATVLDAIKNGLTAHVVLPACRGVSEETSNAAIEEMRKAGAVIWSEEILKRISALMKPEEKKELETAAQAKG